MTKNDDKRVPALRFKGFNDDWAQRKLKNLVSFSKGKGYTKNDLLSNGTPILLYGMLYTNYLERYSNFFTYAKANLKSVYSTKHEVVMPDSGETSVDIARASWVDKPGVILGGGLIILKPKDIIFPGFLAYSLTYGKNHKDIASKAQGKSVVHIHSKDLANLKFFFPKNIVTQRKICNLLEEVNTYISLQQRKLKQYQLIKKWLCSVVFNDTVHDDANILFSNRVKANQLFESISKKGFKDLPVLSASQEKGMVFRDDISKNITYTNSNLNNYKLVSPGNFVVHLRSFQGGFSYSNKIGIASPAYTIFEFKDNIKYDSIFWKEKFKSYNFIQLLKKVTYGVRDGRSISFSDFLSLYLTFPDIEIQKKIGKCFKALDNQISDQQCIIQQLKQLKQFLLQNMFI